LGVVKVGILEAFLNGLLVAIHPNNLLYAGIGAVVGTLVGVLPGLGPAATIAILLPMTFKLDPSSSLIMLAGIYYGTQYGGSTTSILLNIPGESSSVVTTLDGFQMAKQGRAGPALAVAAIGSFIAGTLGVVGLMFLAVPLSEIAVRFGPPEYVGLMVFGLMLASYLGASSVLRAIIMVALGLLIGTIGLDPITGGERFTFGWLTLQNGVGLVPVAMGMFGIGELFSSTDKASTHQQIFAPSGFLPSREEIRRSAGPIVRGGLLGFLIGILPGGGALVASFLAYAVEKRISHNPERFGTGMIEGVAAPEAANNSAVAGAFIPMFIFGIPSNVVMALLMGALMIHGIQPGPLFLKEHPAIVWTVIASMYVGNVMLLVLNLPLVGLFVRLLQFPYWILASVVVLFTLIGAYTLENNIDDVLLTVVFGLVGYVARKLDFPLAPFILALLLGPMLERALRQSLIMSEGYNPIIFLTHPICAVFLILAVLLVCFSTFRRPPTKEEAD
jgi:putative tricarboxylic transport membrane protein